MLRKKWVTHPLFLFGLLLRIILIFFIKPISITNWFAPFLETSLAYISLDPWKIWLSQHGDPAAFPYGYAMWIFLLPFAGLVKIAGISIHYGYSLAILSADFTLLLFLQKLIPKKPIFILFTYWCSPIVILASYGLGLNDIIPTLFLTVSLYLLQQKKMVSAGFFCITAISAKVSILLTLPFILIYLFNTHSLRVLLPRFILGLCISTTVFGLPFLLSLSGLRMLFHNPEMGKMYESAFHLGKGAIIYIIPLVYFLLLYSVWRVKRLNFELFYSVLGLSLFLVILLTSASPGWFIWIVPLFIYYQSMSGRISLWLIGIFSGLWTIETMIAIPSITSIFFSNEFISLSLPSFQEHATAVIHTLILATGGILATRILREAVIHNDYFKFSRNPFVIGIAGDSGAGKDTYADAIKGLFGAHSVATLSGDDYHLWDRQKPMWKVMTHLNPMANNIEGFKNDLLSLIDGNTIFSRHYNHETGKMSLPIKIISNDFIIALGLHALYLPALRECYNLSIYLDIDENLRQFFKLHRDVTQRGHSIDHVLASFEKRKPDSIQFIRPQASYATLLLSLQPIHPTSLLNFNEKTVLRYKLVVHSRKGLDELSLVRVLIGVCGLHVDMENNNEQLETILTIEGETDKEDVAFASKILCPRIIEFLDLEPKWQDGVLGLMQLITLAHIDQTLRNRLP